MKLIIDINDNTLKNIQGYCQTQNIEISTLFENLFNKYVQEPADIIDQIYEKNGDLKDFQEFVKVLKSYLNEAIYDIEMLSSSPEAIEDDERMTRVFKALARDHIDQAHILTSLYKVYKDD